MSLISTVRTLVAGLLAFGTTPVFAADSAEAPAPVTFTEYKLATHVPNFKKAKENKLEKTTLKFGMIKLTDCAVLVVAKELGFFAEEGLNVTIEVQPNWKVVNDRVINMELDGSHMLYNHPLGAAVGYGVTAEIIAPYNISINGMGLTVSNNVWKAMAEKEPRLKEPGYAMPVSAASLKAIASERKAAGQEPLRFFMTFPSGSHNINLRYWLAAGGVHPGYYEGYNDSVGKKDADILLTVNPPPQMAQAMAQGNCDGFCVGEPWNMQVTMKDLTGRPACPSQYVFNGSPDKVFACAKAWADDNPNSMIAVVKGLIRAGQWLDESRANRKLAAEMVANKAYIGANVEVLAESMLGTYTYNMDGGKPDRRPEPEFNIFYKRFASFPFHSHAVWGLTQARRWGQIPSNKSDSWYQETAAKTFRTDIYRAAFAVLLAEGKVKAEDLPAEDSQAHPAEAFIDKIAFDPKKPNEYLQKFPIGQK